MTDTSPITLGIVRGISYGVFGAPGTFMPAVRGLGTRSARLYLTWNQVQPDPARFDWTAVDALFAQIEEGDDIWVTVVSSSRWATRQPTDFLPASPASDMAAYEAFVAALVARCGGKVALWQCNNEPSNAGLWLGTAEEYAEQARAFTRVVRNADPAAKVVLGGCGYDVLSAPADGEPRKFFATVLDRARDSFDLFAVHLYDDPGRIPAHIADVRQMMRAHGGERPVVVGEYGGPTLLGFPSLEPLMQQVMMDAFARPPSLDSADLASQQETPDRRAMRALYAKMETLPPELQMFMQGCPPALEAKRHRIAVREIFTRNLLALAEGVTRIMCWNLAPEVPNYRDRFNLMGFLSDKLALMDFSGTEIARREPAAEAFARLTALLDGATSVRRLESEPGIVAIEVTRAGARVYAFWAEADVFTGEDEPPRPARWPWPHATARTVDSFGIDRALAPSGGTLQLALTVTPVIVEP